MTGTDPEDDGKAPDDADATWRTQPPSVLYITGSGRSGSTLLERMIGGVDGFVNVGELVDLFRWVGPQDERCGCGEPFSGCPFWTQVGDRAFGGWSRELFTRMARLQRKVARRRRVPQLLLRPHGRTMATDLAEYQDHYRRLYAAISEASGAGVVVDASKWPAQALAMARSQQVDVRLLHLVRDVRGVAFSWAKSGVARPHAVTGRTTMAALPVARTAARWSACQVEAEVVGHVASSYHRMRYEDLVAAPSAAVLTALESLGLAQEPRSLAHLDSNTATLGVSHGIGGNPSRFRTGVQALRLDEEWRRAMSPRDRRTATALGLPVLARYDYLGGPPAHG